MSLPVKVFVISLERAESRRAHMTRLFRRLGIEAEFFPAVDGERLTDEDRAHYDSTESRRNYRADMTDAEIGCYLSHYRIYERICRDNLDIALILEDDVAVSPDLPAILESLAKDPDPPWSVMRLQSPLPRILHPKAAKDRGFPVSDVPNGNVFLLQSHVLGCCGYLMRRQAAEAMLTYGRRIVRPIDQTLDRYWENGILPYIVRPLPVWQDDDFSSEIGVRGREIGLDERPLDWLHWRFRRIRDSVNKRWFRMAVSGRQAKLIAQNSRGKKTPPLHRAAIRSPSAV